MPFSLETVVVLVALQTTLVLAPRPQTRFVLLASHDGRGRGLATALGLWASAVPLALIGLLVVTALRVLVRPPADIVTLIGAVVLAMLALGRLWLVFGGHHGAAEAPTPAQPALLAGMRFALGHPAEAVATAAIFAAAGIRADDPLAAVALALVPPTTVLAWNTLVALAGTPTRATAIDTAAPDVVVMTRWSLARITVGTITGRARPRPAADR